MPRRGAKRASDPLPAIVPCPPPRRGSVPRARCRRCARSARPARSQLPPFARRVHAPAARRSPGAGAAGWRAGAPGRSRPGRGRARMRTARSWFRRATRSHLQPPRSRGDWRARRRAAPTRTRRLQILFPWRVLATACAANSAPATLAASSPSRASPGSDFSRSSMTAYPGGDRRAQRRELGAELPGRGPRMSNRCSRR